MIRRSGSERRHMRNICDEHLEFLNDCTAEELDPLLDALLDKDRKGRISSELELTDDYKAYAPDHTRYTAEIAREIQKYGGNTLANIFRGGEGVPYKEVLCDVCDQMDVNFNNRQSVKMIENALLAKVLTQVWEEMTTEERAAVLTDAGFKSTNAGGITSAAMVAAFRAGGFESYKLTLIVVNSVWKILFGKGLTFAGNRILCQFLKILTGPVGWAITGVWTAIDVASPAMRVTIPAAIYIAGLRRMKSEKAALAQLEKA